jgi:hypothetical protein
MLHRTNYPDTTSCAQWLNMEIESFHSLEGRKTMETSQLVKQKASTSQGGAGFLRMPIKSG